MSPAAGGKNRIMICGIELPVQAPTKYELVVNSRPPRRSALPVPPTLLATADEVIE